MRARASALAMPSSTRAPAPSQGSASLPAIIAANAVGLMPVPNSACLPRRGGTCHGVVHQGHAWVLYFFASHKASHLQD